MNSSLINVPDNVKLEVTINRTDLIVAGAIIGLVFGLLMIIGIVVARNV